MESVVPEEYEQVQQGNGIIKNIGIKHDAAYLYLDVELTKALDVQNEKLFIGLDTYNRDKGEFRFTQESIIEAPTGMEFLLELGNEQNSRLLAHPGYNIANGRYSSYKSFEGIFEEIHQLTSKERVTKDGRKIDAVYQNESRLKFGELQDNSYNQLDIENNKFRVRIPWGRINFTDPSTMTVLDDTSNPAELTRDLLKTVQSDGILVSVLLYNIQLHRKLDSLNLEKPYSWEAWDEPVYRERLKKSYYIIQEYFSR